MKYNVEQWRLYSLEVNALDAEHALVIAGKKETKIVEQWKEIDREPAEVVKAPIRSEPHKISEPMPLCRETHCKHPTCTRLCCSCGFIKDFSYSKKI